MKRLSAILLLLGSVAFADGPPVDRETGAITAQHETVAVSAAQVREIDGLGTITLDPSQFKRLRQRHPNAPVRLLVLPLMYDDCTCGMDPYALRTGPRTIAIPFSSLDLVGRLEGVLREGAGSLRLAPDGTLLYLGATFSVAQFRDLFVRIDVTSGEDPDNAPRVLFVTLPEPYPPTSPAVLRSVAALRQLLQSKGWRLAFPDAIERGSSDASASPSGGT